MQFLESLLLNTFLRKQDLQKLNASELNLSKQFRVLGGEKYLNFIHDIFEPETKVKSNFENYEFKFFDDVEKMIDEIKKRNNEVGLARVVAGFAWPWLTAEGERDYDIEIGETKLVWNSVNEDWINSPNAINEVGCIHTVQGYDLNYTGVIIGPELSYDKLNKKFIIYKKKYFDTKGHAGVYDLNELEGYIINIYKTLLTRGIRGTYLYIVDENLRDYFKEKLGVNNDNKKEIETPYNFVKIPLFESVGCGPAMHANTEPEDYIDVDKKLVKPGAKYFALRTNGDSMNKAGINSGDIVLCRKNYQPENGNRVVALIGDDATIKIYKKTSSQIILEPRSTNPDYKPLVFEKGDEIFVQGVVVEVLKK